MLSPLRDVHGVVSRAYLCEDHALVVVFDYYFSSGKAFVLPVEEEFVSTAQVLAACLPFTPEIVILKGFEEPSMLSFVCLG